jgi:uncharacterized protein (UPF0548 family)
LDDVSAQLNSDLSARHADCSKRNCFVVVNHGFCWSLNPCRVVYVLEETGGEIERYGFAFGTLPGHSEEGEERFTVERRRADDSVWYELLSFARPHHIHIWTFF